MNMQVYHFSSAVLFVAMLSSLKLSTANKTTAMKHYDSLLEDKRHYNRLLGDLFLNYSQYARPGGINEPTQVEITFTPMKLLDLDVRLESICLRFVLLFTWTDVTLSWTPSMYGDIKVLHYPQSKLWLPSINLYSSSAKMAQMGFDERLVTIHSSGKLEWGVIENDRFDCVIDVSLYPFDFQNCSIFIHYDPLTRDDIMITTSKYQPFISPLLESGGSWDVVDYQCYNIIFETAIATIGYQKYEFIFKRRTTFYIVNIVLPVVFLSFTASAVFAVPAEAGEKIGLSVTILLAYSVYLSIIAGDLPRTSSQV